MATTTFDPVKFKETTRAQWQNAAKAWNDWGGLLSRWLGPATERMLDLAGVGEGSRVLDVAAGAGDQTLTAARRTGPSGRVLATDLSPAILDFAAQNASSQGLDHVSTQVLDGEELDTLPGGSFDAVISRVGMIYFPDQLKALRGMHHALREGGRVALVSYSTADKNGFFSVPVGIIRKRAGLPAPLPGQPGPFSLGTTEVMTELLEAAGFREVQAELMDAPVLLDTAEECLAFEKESFGALHQMLSGLDPVEQESVWNEIAEALREYQTDKGFVGPCELVIGAGVK